MRRGRRRLITAAEGIEPWRMYKAGESIQGISRGLSRNSSSINRVLQSTGGIGPAERVRSRSVLSLAEREEISRGIAAGCSIRIRRRRRLEAIRLYPMVEECGEVSEAFESRARHS